MTLDRDIEVLRRVPFFADVPAEPVKLLAFSAETRDVGDGTVLFREGDAAEGAIVVMSGRVDLAIGEGAARKVVTSCGPGSLMGELALLVETIRPATAAAVGTARVCSIRRPMFRRVLEEYPDVARMIQARLIENLAALDPAISGIRTIMEGIDEAEA